MFHYSAYGLRFASDMRLPNFPLCADAEGSADVEIVQGFVPDRVADCDPQGPFLQVAHTQKVRFAVSGIAAYLIENGNRITVSPDTGGAEQDIALFLSGTAIGVLCHQRGLFPLHAATVEIGGRAVAFAADSGHGKSTLAAALTQRGYRLLSDDITVIDVNAEGGPLVMPALPQQRLWQDSLTALGLTPGRRVRSNQALDKFERSLDAAFLAEPRRLGAICHLLGRMSLSDGPTIEPLVGNDAVMRLRGQIYRLHAAQGMDLEPRLFMDTGRLSAKVPQYLLRRQNGFEGFADFIDVVLDRLGGDGEAR